MMYTQPTAYSILKQLILTVNDMNTEQCENLKDKEFSIQSQSPDESAIRMFNTLKDISDRLNVPDEQASQDVYRLKEQCIIKTPMGLYKLKLEGGSITVHLIPAQFPIVDVTVDARNFENNDQVFSAVIESIQYLSNFDKRDLEQYPDVFDDNSLNTFVALVTNSTHKIKKLEKLEDFIKFSHKVELINEIEFNLLVSELKMGKEWFLDVAQVTSIEKLFNDTLKGYNRHLSELKNGYYYFNDNDDALIVIENKNYIAISIKDQIYNTVIIRNKLNSEIKIWNAANITQEYFSENIEEHRKDHVIDSKSIVQYLCSGQYNNNFPIEMSHPSFEKSLDYLSEHFDDEGDHLMFQSTKGVHKNFNTLILNRMEHFNYINRWIL